MTVTLTDQEFARIFTEFPDVARAPSGSPLCPYCGAALGPTALDYWNGATEAGTPYCRIEITCHSCHRVVWRGGSWWPDIATKRELIDVATEVLADRFEGQLDYIP